MNNDFNLVAVYIANIVAITLLITVRSGNYWKVGWRNEEKLYLKLLMIAIGVAALGDSVSFTIDGTPGETMSVVAYIAALVPYLMDLLCGYSWILFLVCHLQGRMSKAHEYVLKGIAVAATAMLLVNFFYPTIFYIDENNCYVRAPLFYVSLLVNFLYFADSVVIYFVLRKKSGVMAFFPVWKYIIPIVLGMVLQTLFYGISLIWVGAAIAMVGVVNSLQSELIYVDKLTGLFNRFYLDEVREELAKNKNSSCTVMMLDLNCFKQINDKFGHSVGDEALISTARILEKAIDGEGRVIRYAGDEFVVVLNTSDDTKSDACVTRILTGFDEFNETSKKPYELHTSIGYCTVDMKNSTVEAMMNMVDKLMYEDKSKFYQEHPELERRK